MIYQGIYQGQPINFTDWLSALMGAKELGLTYFFIRESAFSVEPFNLVMILDGGVWKRKQLQDMACCCGDWECSHVLH